MDPGKQAPRLVPRPGGSLRLHPRAGDDRPSGRHRLARGACHGENRMRGFGSAAWPRVAIMGALGLALAGCADVDEALFGPYPATQTTQAAPGDNTQAEASGDQASTETKALPPAAEAEA